MPSLITEIDDALDHLRGAVAALEDVRAHLTGDREMVPDDHPGVTP